MLLTMLIDNNSICTKLYEAADDDLECNLW